MSQAEKDRGIVIPHYLTPDHLLGFVEALSSLGGRIDSMFLGDILGEKVDVLPHVIDVAEALGIVTVGDGGELILTELGEKIVKGNVKIVKKLLRENAKKIEPLKSILDLLKEKKKIPVEEFERVLSKFYYLHTSEAKINILQWGAFLGLFKMDANDKYVIML